MRPRFDGEPLMFLGLLESLLDDCDAACALGAAGLENPEALAMNMHELEGSARTLAAGAIADAAHHVEMLCKQDNADAIGAALEELTQCARRVRQALPTHETAAFRNR